MIPCYTPTLQIAPIGRKFLLETRGHKCEKCGNDYWNGIPITLQIHHINGKSADQRLENIQLLCPNCHYQTDTQGGKNKGNSDRVDRYNN